MVGGGEMPSPYGDFLRQVNVLTFDTIQMLPFDCLYDGDFNHLDKLLLETLIPMAVLGLALALTVLPVMTRPKDAWAKSRSTLANFFLVLFLVLPTISLRIAQSFRCTEYAVGEDTGVVSLTSPRFLEADAHVNCGPVSSPTSLYRQMLVYAIIQAFIYPLGIPLLILSMLWNIRDELKGTKIRDELGPRSSEAEDEASLAERIWRSDLTDREPISYFAMRYRPTYWWYEVYTMFRRLLLTCFPVWIPTLPISTIYVIGMSLITLVFEKESAPHLNPFLSAFSYLLHWQIVFVFLFLLLLDAGFTKNAGGVLIGVGLTIANVVLMLVVFVDTRIRKKQSDANRMLRAWSATNRSTLQPSTELVDRPTKVTTQGNPIHHDDHVVAQQVNPLFGLVEKPHEQSKAAEVVAVDILDRPHAAGKELSPASPASGPPSGSGNKGQKGESCGGSGMI